VLKTVIILSVNFTRLYWDNKIRVNVTEVSEYGLKMEICIEGNTRRGSLAYKVSRYSIFHSYP